MAHAIRIHATGGPEVLKWEAVEVGEPGPARCGCGRLPSASTTSTSITAAASTSWPSFPAIIGMEGAGTVEAVGPGVTDIKVGDRVAYAGVLGAYADERLIPADRLVKLPDGIDDVTAAAMMLQGMTARYLLRETYRCTPETVLLFHAAAGGVGLIVCQWAKAIGATMIGTVGSDEKAQLAQAAGCTHVINYRTEDYVARVREITGGVGCDVVYDGVGKDTFPSSLDCLKPRGLWVSFGNASGAGAAVRHADPFGQGLALCDAADGHDLHGAARGSSRQRSGAVRAWSPGARSRSRRAAPIRCARRRRRTAILEARKTTGSIVLIP